MAVPMISIAAGILVFSLIMIIFGRSASERDSIKKRLDDLSREKTAVFSSLEEEMNKPFTERVLKPAIRKLTNAFSNIVPIKKGEQKTSERQKKMLQQAGWTIQVEEYMVIQLVLMLGLGIVGVIIAVVMNADTTHTILYFFGGAFTAYAVMRFICTSKGTSRKTAMEKQLPDMLDLLSVSVAAGLGFERAMLHVIETMDGPLIDEFAVSYREMSMGRSRKDALTLLGERCGVEDLTSVTSALVQAGQLGIPIKNVLQSQAAAIRRSRKAKVQEKAAKVSTKMLLPMVGLIFPVLIIVLMGPSIISIMDTLG